MYRALALLSTSVASHTASFGNSIQQPLNPAPKSPKGDFEELNNIYISNDGR